MYDGLLVLLTFKGKILKTENNTIGLTKTIHFERVG